MDILRTLWAPFAVVGRVVARWWQGPVRGVGRDSADAWGMPSRERTAAVPAARRAVEPLAAVVL
ncbi:hypothetical protein, partial [Kineococcus glutinatus]|uniref:hypothetical protein n=1 Tax=Kineococcus glutinatus TaxID=1070872 RepID=UPI0031EA6124